MKKILLVLIMLFPSVLIAQEKKDDDMTSAIELMVVAKATGMCGFLSQLINFQQTTQMAGGDEFVLRFLKTESTRLGHTVKSLLGQCPSVVEKYNSTMQSLGYEK